MAQPIDIDAGRILWKSLQEYPLPRKSGVRDYVFHMIANRRDGYRRGGIAFFDKYYPRHRKRFASSLEGIIDELYTEVRRGRITQIRELVIVCHANTRELIFPVVKSSSEKDSHYASVRVSSLRNLQIAFKEKNQFQGFRDKRQKVVQKFLDSSWVTIRACRFGHADNSMLALYAFFGGRANVFAPVWYQFFDFEVAVGGEYKALSKYKSGKRIPAIKFRTKEEFYLHLVKQGFVRRAKLGRNGKDRAMNRFLDLAKSHRGFNLARYAFNSHSVEGDQEELEEIASSLDRLELSESIKQVFQEQDFLLSDDAQLTVDKEGRRWTIEEQELEIGKVDYTLAYRIERKYEYHFSADDYAEHITVTPILDHSGGKHTTPVQSFYNEEENEILKGYLFELASYMTLPGGEGAEIQAAYDKYQVFIQLLDAHSLTGQDGYSITDAFEEKEEELGADVTISGPESDSRGRKIWTIQSSDGQYTVKAISNYTIGNRIKRTLMVIKLKNQLERAQFIEQAGMNPDMPGTELLAYLYTLTLEDLENLIYTLRNPYRPAHAFYIYYAQKVQQDKNPDHRLHIDQKIKDFAFFLDGVDESQMSAKEQEDHARYAYPPWDYWTQAKWQNQEDISFHQDLFEEDDLPFAPDTYTNAPLPPISPDPDEGTPRISIDIPEPPPEFFEKEIVDDGEEPPQISCGQFKQILGYIKDTKTRFPELTPSEVIKFVSRYEVGDEYTGIDYLKSHPFQITYQALQMFSPYAGTGGTVGYLGTLANSRLVFVCGAALAITGPLLMWKKAILDPIAEGAASFKQRGEVTGAYYGSLMIHQIVLDLKNYSISIKDFYHLLPQAPDHRDAYRTIYKSSVTYLVPFSTWIEHHEQGYEWGLIQTNILLNKVLSEYEDIVGRAMIRQGMDYCHAKVLLNSGLLDHNWVKAQILTQLYKDIRKHVEPYMDDR